MWKANKSAKGSIEIQYEAYDKHGINGLYHNLIKVIHTYFLQLFFLKICLHACQIYSTLYFTSLHNYHEDCSIKQHLSVNLYS